jgi:hypothetical protein
MTIEGKIFLKEFSRGSKSEYKAVYIETSKGNFVLREKGENPRKNPALEKLEGKRVKAEGILKDYLFLATNIHEIE